MLRGQFSNQGLHLPSPMLCSHDMLKISTGHMALLLVVLQTTAHVLMMRHTRMRAEKPYLVSTAVLLMEAIKMTVCIGVVAFQVCVLLGTLLTPPPTGGQLFLHLGCISGPLLFE